jgi:SAM-dependent methyltransferase
MATTWNTMSYSAKYAKYRPTYPPALYKRILAEVPEGRRGVLVDIGCGSGQATIPMSKHFKRTLGVDSEATQIAEAAAAAKADGGCGTVAFEIGRAGERSIFDAMRRAFPDGEKADVIIVAEALHWFDLQRFNAHLPHLLKPNGLLAVWVYQADDLTPVPCDGIFKKMHHMLLVSNHWPKERLHIEDCYARIVPQMAMRLTATVKMRPVTRRSVEEFAAYLSTWSGIIRYMEQTGDTALLDRLSDDLRRALSAEASPELTCELPITLFLFRHDAANTRAQRQQITSRL